MAVGFELVNDTRMEVVNLNFGSVFRGRTRRAVVNGSLCLTNRG